MSYNYRVTSRSVPVRTRTTITSSGLDPEMERTRREFERMHRGALHQPLDSAWGHDQFLDSSLSPMLHGTSSISSSKSSMYETNPETGKREFRYTFDVKGVQPEDVQVKVIGDTLTVSGDAEEKLGSTSVKRSYTRKVDLPNDIERSLLKATLNENGYLQIGAPVIETAETSSPSKTTPVKVTRASAYKGEYSLTLDVGREFVDGELSVHYVDAEKKVIAKGKTTKNHVNRVSIREFTEECDVGCSIDADSIKASMDDFGKLTIKADKM